MQTPFETRVHVAYTAAILRLGPDLDASARSAACMAERARLHRCLDMARALDAGRA